MSAVRLTNINKTIRYLISARSCFGSKKGVCSSRDSTRMSHNEVILMSLMNVTYNELFDTVYSCFVHKKQHITIHICHNKLTYFTCLLQI